MSIIRKIKDYYKKPKKRILFTTPSHSQGDFIIPSLKKLIGEKYFKADFSEIEGFDNLRNPEGIIKQLQEKISCIYNSKKTFLLTNGSTSGIITLMLAVLSENDKVLIARNCHISVYNGLVLSGAKPIWFLPEYDKEWEIYKGVKKSNIENILKKHNDIKALIITSPTYEGSFSELDKIAELCKQSNITFIVDEAHGALLNFGEFKSKPAILCGADASVQSLHKTAGAPNPCALIHISQKSRISIEKIQDTLNLINTTSPSYPLLAAIEADIKYLHSSNGRNKLSKLLNEIREFKDELPDNAEIYEGNNDPTKLLIKIKNTAAQSAANILNKRFHIEEEFSNNKSMLFITGIGTTNKKLKELNNALKAICKESIIHSNTLNSTNYILPKSIYTPKQAFQSLQKDRIDIDKSLGKTCAEIIMNYPPGIPILLPGEQIDSSIIDFIKCRTNIKQIDVIVE